LGQGQAFSGKGGPGSRDCLDQMDGLSRNSDPVVELDSHSCELPSIDASPVAQIDAHDASRNPAGAGLEDLPPVGSALVHVVTISAGDVGWPRWAWVSRPHEERPVGAEKGVRRTAFRLPESFIPSVAPGRGRVRRRSRHRATRASCRWGATRGDKPWRSAVADAHVGNVAVRSRRHRKKVSDGTGQVATGWADIPSDRDIVASSCRNGGGVLPNTFLV
jgi:hypothetical protein